MADALPSGLSKLALYDYFLHAPTAKAILDDHGQILQFNEAFERLTNRLNRSEFKQILPEDEAQKFTQAFNDLRAECRAKQSTVNAPPLALTLRLSDTVKSASAYLTALYVDAASAPIFILQLIDQTEQKNLEARFAHSQKMQAVGQLAGGVAHDFNNLLTAMIGFCDLLLMRHPAGDPSFADIMQVKQNANRAANLVRQLLAFSRKQTLQPKVLDIGDVLAEISNLIRRLIGESIHMELVHGRGVGSVLADQGQLEQVIINLAVNARDAMSGGGTLKIATSHAHIASHHQADSRLIAPSDEDVLQPGDYVLIEITDSGTGIDPAIIKNIFEPFYSTKEVGSGTGLGLSTCYGIVKQTGGYMFVRSTPGVGTSFYVYLKQVGAQQTEQEASPEFSGEHSAQDLTGKAKILLVEDETPVRIFAARALRNKGYEVVEADSGDTALEMFPKHADSIDLIISDVVMPGTTGPNMILQLEKHYPEIMARTPVVFISGYAEDAFADSFGSDREFQFLAKPFTLKQLAGKVKEVLSAAVSTAH